MAQITNGVRAILSHPYVYSAFQSLMGAHKGRQRFVAEYVRPFFGMAILDIGCGPAEILAYLPNVDYRGFDISEDYIGQARQKFGSRGVFHVSILGTSDLETLPEFDVVFALGLLHHLDDEEAAGVFRLAHAALRPGGRLLTIDPCLDPSQNPVSRFLVRNDRGQNVREKAAYEALALTAFESPRVDVRHQAWIPYTHCFMECRK
jgi:SAM-dependent methyltransferase